ncbi:MAG TPA: glycosyltransferase, partial [Gemmatimonadaceae bacterium]|nr:glycosyltransferase [Gemmatimonadaceae bacterium]
SASDLDRHAWELIVVDDGSADPETARLAATADRVVTLPAPASGPAAARNAGAGVANGRWLAFVDADVLVHADALRRMLDGLENSGAAAIFGSYDDMPAARGIVSQYRNLLHHRVHQRNAGDVESFWAGCGAVERNAFNSVGQFDATRFRRPEMEDVDLGYRLRDAGYRIVLDPAILCTHLKRWTLTGMIASDFSRRGLPWARLLVERKMLLNPRGLSLGAGERTSALLSFLAAASVLFAVLLQSRAAAMFAAATFVLFVASNAPLFRWLGVKRGWRFAASAMPLHFIYSVNAVAALTVGALQGWFSPRSEPARYTRPR